MSDVYLFAGPTLLRAQAIVKTLPLGDIVVLPPIARGDLPALMRANVGAGDARTAPGTVIVVDGFFHVRLAVGHAEIRDALRAGWRVYGLSSMGAIRAREMSHLGMVGCGQVYAQYCQPDVDFRDDEVTLLHEPQPPYRELSEPLIHLRAATADLIAEGLLSVAAGEAIVADLSARWFGDRTLPLYRALIAQGVSDRDTLAAIEARLGDFNRYRIKAHDLIAFLQTRPDLDALRQRV